MFGKSLEGKDMLAVQSNILIQVHIMKVKVDRLLLLMNYEGNMQMHCIYELCNY